MKKLLPAIALAAAASLALPDLANAGSITFLNTTTDETGSGFGNITNLLSVQGTGNATSQFGAVLWDGTARVLQDDAKNNSEVPTAGALQAAGFTGAFNLIFNINEGQDGNTVVVNDFVLRFFSPTGATLFDITFDAPSGGLTLAQIGNGQGAAGWLFSVQLTAGEAASFFGDANNRVGQLITQGNAITDIGGGAENFFIAVPAVPVPEPSTWAMLGAGFMMLGWMARRRGQR